MKVIVRIIALALIFSTPLEAQTRKKGKASPKQNTARKPQPAPITATARIIGSPVLLVTKNGDQIRGVVLDLTAYSVRVKADNLESTHALDTLASITFGTSPSPAARSEQPESAPRPEFVNQANAVFNAFQAMADGLTGSADYTEYDYQLRNLRPMAEQFTSRYGLTDNKSEAQVAALVAGALTDYTWARTIWTSKFGRNSQGMASDSDLSEITETLILYPDIKTAAANGNKYSVDKLVGGLWRKASEKIDRARSITNPGR